MFRWHLAKISRVALWFTPASDASKLNFAGLRKEFRLAELWYAICLPASRFAAQFRHRVNLPREVAGGAMLPGIYSAATGMTAAEIQHEVVSQNLANADVPGYRRSHVTFESFDEALAESTGEPTAPSGLGTRLATVALDFTPGIVQPTGRNLDAAIQGDAFFVLESPEGAPLYTRNGVFQVNAEGALVTSSGMSVRGTGGPIVLPAGSSVEGLRIAGDGSISVGGTAIGQLELVRFEDNQQLIPVGTSLFVANSEAISANGEVQVQEGMRELSNVNAVTELVNMIAAVRHYEASQRAIQSIAEAVEDNTDPNAG